MIYLSFDVETSGPSPVSGKLLSIGIVPVYIPEDPPFTSAVLNHLDFYRVVKHEHLVFDKATHKFWEQFPERLEEATVSSESVTTRQLAYDILSYYYSVRAWAAKTGVFATPVFAARPAVFDFHWLRDLMEREVPYPWRDLEHVSYSCVDIGSVVAGCLGLSYDEASRRANWPEHWKTNNEKPHHALHDAIEQAHLLAGVLSDSRG